MKTNVYFPNLLLQAVKDLKLTRTNHSHLFRLLAKAIYTLNETDGDIESFYLPWSKSYILKVTSDPFYRKFIRLSRNLKKEPDSKQSSDFTKDIFETNGRFAQGIPLHYRITPSLLDDSEMSAVEVTFDDDINLNSLFPEVINHFDRTFEILSIEHERIRNNMDDLLSPFTVEVAENIHVIARDVHEAYAFESMDYESIKSRTYRKVKIGDTHLFMSSKVGIPFLQRKAKEQEQPSCIILEDEHAYIGDKFDYLDKKGERMKRHLNYQLLQLKSSKPHRAISTTNGRLHSVITNLNSFALHFTKLDGESLCSVDLRASQPTILANLFCGNSLLNQSISNSLYPNLHNLNDFINEHSEPSIWNSFLNYLVEEDIYLFLADATKSSRMEAKIEMLRLLFSKPGYTSKFHNHLNEKFDELGTHIKQLKKDVVENLRISLPVLLQQIEAHIFIETILTELASKQIPAFTKHDSVVCKSSDEDKVHGIISSHFDELNFKGILKTTEHRIDPSDDDKFKSPFYNDYYYLRRFEKEYQADEELAEWLGKADEQAPLDWSKFQTKNGGK